MSTRRFVNDYAADGKARRMAAREAWGNVCVRCQSPSVPGKILTTHHFDGDKANDHWSNLMPLCQVCHLQVQSKVDPRIPISSSIPNGQSHSSRVFMRRNTRGGTSRAKKPKRAWTSCWHTKGRHDRDRSRTRQAHPPRVPGRQAGRGMLPKGEAAQWLGDAVSVTSNGRTMRIGDLYERRGDYCEAGRWVVPFGFYRSSVNVWAWCCFPLNLDKRGRRTWSFVLVGGVEECEVNV